MRGLDFPLKPNRAEHSRSPIGYAISTLGTIVRNVWDVEKVSIRADVPSWLFRLGPRLLGVRQQNVQPHCYLVRCFLRIIQWRFEESVLSMQPSITKALAMEARRSDFDLQKAVRGVRFPIDDDPLHIG